MDRISSKTSLFAPLGKDSVSGPVTNRIVMAAFQCFERFGIAKTTIGDIATAAGVSRPTVYKHFVGKDEIVEWLSTQATLKMNVEIRSRLRRNLNMAETITHVLLIGTRMASHDPYIRRFTENLHVSSRAADPDSPMHKVQTEAWSQFLDRAAQRGELATDLTRKEIISWLALAQELLLVKVDALVVSENELKRFILRFIVRPLLNDVSPRASSRENRPARK